MKSKKIIAGVLCVTLTAGFAGCDNTKKDREAIGKIIDACADAFKEDDAEAFLELTDWDEDDKSYQQVENAMNSDFEGDDYYRDCYSLIFDSIEIDYDIEDIEFKGDKASISVKYEVLDWNDVNFKVNDLYLPYKDAIEDEKDTISIKGKIDFKLVDGEWKITKITNLDELFSFNGLIIEPDFVPTPAPDPTESQPTVPDPTETQPTETQPVTTEPTGTSETTAYSDSFEKTMRAFKTVLEQNRDAIQLTEVTFGINAVGFYDLDGNGLPELYFISDDGNEYSASLHVYEYNEYAGEAIEVVTSPEIITQGQASSYIIYATDKELIVTYTYGESYFLHVSTDMYALGEREGGIHKWDLCETFAREIISDYDPETDTETVTKVFYHNAKNYTEDEYMPTMKGFTERTVMTLGRHYVLSSNDPEYGLMSKPSNGMLGYGLAIDYVESGI